MKVGPVVGFHPLRLSVLLISPSRQAVEKWLCMLMLPLHWVTLSILRVYNWNSIRVLQKSIYSRFHSSYRTSCCRRCQHHWNGGLINISFHLTTWFVDSGFLCAWVAYYINSSALSCNLLLGHAVSSVPISISKRNRGHDFSFRAKDLFQDVLQPLLVS